MPTQFANAEAGWVILSSAEARLKAKIEEAGTPLKDWDVSIYRGILTGFNEAFIIDGATREKLISQSPESVEIIRPLLRGQDIKKYKIDFQNKWIIFSKRGIDIKKYISIEEHLAVYKDRLMPKPINHEGLWTGRKSGNYKWFEIQDAVDYWSQFESPKVVWQELSRSGNAFSYVHEPMYLNNTGYILTGVSIETLKYLTAILNHNVSLFYLEQVYNKLDNTGWRWFKVAVEKIPIPYADLQTVCRIANLVEMIQKYNSLNHDSSHLQKQVDFEIYKLYNYTEAEIEILNAKINSYF